MCVTMVAVCSLLSFFLPLSMCSLGLPVCFDMLFTSKCLLRSYWDHLLIIFRLTHFVNYGEMFCRFEQICVCCFFFPHKLCWKSVATSLSISFFLLPFLFILSRTTWCQRSMWKQCANQCWTSALFPATSKYVMSSWQSWVAFHKRYGL
jgi:hypothetical protein